MTGAAVQVPEAATTHTAWLPDGFFADVARMGQRRRTNPADYLVVWCRESGLRPDAVNPKTGARGLNQMMPKTLSGLGAPADFDKLAASAQLPWIERLIPAGEMLNGGPFRSAARYYHANFYPATMVRGSKASTVVVAADAADAQERAAYRDNRALDADGNGRITLGDLAVVLESERTRPVCAEALERLDAAVGALPEPGITWPQAVARSGRRRAAFGLALAAGAVALSVMRARSTRRGP
jgi:hypothetical protein